MPTSARLLVTVVAITLITLTALVLFADCSARPAGKYYVSPAGSDSSSGRTRAAAFATIQRALDEAGRGAVITLDSGVYYQDAVTRRAGVTITGPASAVVEGAGSAKVLQVRHDDTTLEGFTIDGLAGRDSADGYRNKLVYVMSTTPGDGVSGLQIRNMTIRNAGGECIRLRYLVRDAQIAHNVIGPCGVYDFRFSDGGKNGEGIYLGTAPEQQGEHGAPDDRPDVSRNNRIYGNRIDTQGNECVDIKENATANLVDGNSCTGQRDPASAGFDARGSGNTFRGNVARGNAGAGVRLGGDGPRDGTGNTLVGNELADNLRGGIKFQVAQQGAVCDNRMSGNGGGDTVGAYGNSFNPTAPCTGLQKLKLELGDSFRYRLADSTRGTAMMMSIGMLFLLVLILLVVSAVIWFAREQRWDRGDGTPEEILDPRVAQRNASST